MNKLILMGAAVETPEKQISRSSGAPYCELELATLERKRGRDGILEKAAEYHRVLLFGEAALAALESVKVGTAVLIEGRVKSSQRTLEGGKKIPVTEIIGLSIEFPEGRLKRRSPRTTTYQGRSKGFPVHDSKEAHD